MGSVIFVDTSVVVAILLKQSDWRDFSQAIEAAETRLTSAVVRLETCLVLGTRLKLSPREAERQFESFLLTADIEEAPIDSAIGAAAVACFERYGKGRHPARLNFAECLSYAGARALRAKLLFKGDDFSKSDANSWI